MSVPSQSFKPSTLSIVNCQLSIMAIVENPKIGRASGKIGNVVFATQFGKNTLRSKPVNVKNPRTPAQMLIRNRVKKLVPLFSHLLNNINAAYAGSVQNRSPYNLVMSVNLKCCFVNDTTTIDPGLFVLCDNDGSFVNNVVLTSSVANTITGTFDSNTQNADEDGDPLKAYGFYADGNKIWQFDQEAIRSTGIITLTQPEMSTLKIAVYFECLDRINLLNGNPKHIIKYVGILTVL
jgi:hypothetical protein